MTGKHGQLPNYVVTHRRKGRDRLVNVAFKVFALRRVETVGTVEYCFSLEPPNPPGPPASLWAVLAWKSGKGVT